MDLVRPKVYDLIEREPMSHKQHQDDATLKAQHDARQADRKAAQDPETVDRFWTYLQGLDDSGRYVALGRYPRMAEALVGRGGAYNAEVQRIEGGSAYQTADGFPIDPTVNVPAFS